VFVTNIGLALKEVLTEEEGAIAYSVVNFNALPGAYVVRKRSLAESAWLPVVVGGVIIVAAGIGLCVYANGQNNSLAADVKAVEDRIVEQKVRDSDITALETQVSGAQTNAGQLQASLLAWEVNRDVFGGDLAEAYISLPQGVTLYSVSRAEASVSLSGTADDEASLFDYAWALREGGRFGSVLVNSIAMGDGSISWTIVLTGTTTAS